MAQLGVNLNPKLSETTFVMPFRYAREKSGGSNPRFLKDPPSPARRSYFMPDTSRLLFEDALWLREDAPVAHRAWKQGLSITEHPRRVVLFERLEVHKAPATPLRLGLVICRVTFEHSESLDAASFLDFNEAYRFRKHPYEPKPGEKWWYEKSCFEPLIPTSPSGPTPAAALRWLESRWTEAMDSTTEPAEDAADRWFSSNDHRGFVWTSTALADGSTPEIESALWVKLVNVDAGTPVGSLSDFNRDWIQKRTYKRWAPASLFGFATHAGALLTDGKFPMNHEHFREMYLDQALLLLYLREATFAVSDALSGVSRRAARGASVAKTEQDFKELKRQFTLFTNLYEYPILSNQQEGSEMYARQRKIMDIEEFFREIQSEVHATDEYFSGLRAAKLNQIAAYVGSFGVAVALFQLLGLNPLRSTWPALLEALQVPLATILLACLIHWVFENSRTGGGK